MTNTNNKTDDLAEAKKPQEKSLPDAVNETLHYIGPTIIKFDLVSGRTYQKLPANIKTLIEKHPEIKHLLISSDELVNAMQRVQQVGSFENKIFNELKGL